MGSNRWRGFVAVAVAVVVFTFYYPKGVVVCIDLQLSISMLVITIWPLKSNEKGESRIRLFILVPRM